MSKRGGHAASNRGNRRKNASLTETGPFSQQKRSAGKQCAFFPPLSLPFSLSPLCPSFFHSSTYFFDPRSNPRPRFFSESARSSLLASPLLFQSVENASRILEIESSRRSPFPLHPGNRCTRYSDLAWISKISPYRKYPDFFEFFVSAIFSRLSRQRDNKKRVNATRIMDRSPSETHRECILFNKTESHVLA